MKAVDCKANWIWKSDEVKINDFGYFRKCVELGEEVLTATIFVSAHNHYELFINGCRVGGYVSPAPSHPQKSKLYVALDITHLLKKGTNSFCAVVHYLGGQGQNYVDGKPGFLLQVELAFADGSLKEIITDDTWKCCEQTAYRNQAPFQQNRRLSSIEIYDARLEQVGWLEPHFDDSNWTFAKPSRIEEEAWVMKPQQIPEGGIERIIIPTPCGIQKQGQQVFDAGKILSGWPTMQLEGIRDVCVRFRYSENLDAAGSVRHNVCNEASENYYDEYIMAGRGMEVWEPCFAYKAFRYIEVTGYPEFVTPNEIQLVEAHTALDYQGDFSCSNETLNEIYRACIQTQKNNILGQMTDCPHREQAQYLADSDLQAETFGYNFLNPSVLIKVLSDFQDAQLENGTFPFVFPSNYECPDFNIKIPEWDLHFCMLLWKTYYLYGDVEILKQFYPAAKRMLAYYLGQKNPQIGLIPKSKNWHISDWPYPKVDGSGDFLTVQNCKVYYCFGLMAKIADILGFEKERETYLEEAHNLKHSILLYLYDGQSKRFYDSYGSQSASQAVNVIGYHYGLVPEEDRDTMLEYISEQGFDCSTLISMNLLRVLFENGKKDLALSILMSEEAPGWGYMVKQGYRTVWEGFQDIESHSHAWNAYPARMLMEYVAGIRAISPGFEKVEIKPYMSGLLEYVEAKVPTVRGTIHVKWHREGASKVLQVELPEGVSGSVYLAEGEASQAIGPGKYCFVIPSL